MLDNIWSMLERYSFTSASVTWVPRLIFQFSFSKLLKVDFTEERELSTSCTAVEKLLNLVSAPSKAMEEAASLISVRERCRLPCSIRSSDTALWSIVLNSSVVTVVSFRASVKDLVLKFTLSVEEPVIS